jgi:hypothetical protein
VLTYEENASGRSVTYTSGTSSVDSSKYQAMYTALCKTLCTDESKYELIGNDVFSTIVAYDKLDSDNDELHSFLGDNHTIAKEYGSSMRVVLTSEDKYVLTAEDCAKNTLIIATGDVAINPGAGITSFTGTIIAGGVISVNNGSNFTIAPMSESVLRSLLAQQITNEDAAVLDTGMNKAVYNFFREGAAYLSEDGVDAGVGNQISDLIVYQNWKKK